MAGDAADRNDCDLLTCFGIDNAQGGVVFVYDEERAGCSVCSGASGGNERQKTKRKE